MTKLGSPATHTSSAARWGWLIIGGLLTAAVLAGGVFLAWQLYTGSGLNRQIDHASLSSGKSPSAVELEGSSANVDLSGDDTDEATADLELSWYASEQPAIESVWEGQTTWSVNLECRHEGIPLWFAPGCGIDYLGRMPEEAEAEVHLSSGSVAVRDISGATDLRTASGRIEAYEVSGDLAASATSGNIHGVGLTSENITAHTTSGSITLELLEAPDRLQAETTTGNIEVLVPQGQSYQVIPDSSGGRVTIDVTTDPDAESTIDLRTTSGSITVAYSD